MSHPWQTSPHAPLPGHYAQEPDTVPAGVFSSIDGLRFTPSGHRFVFNRGDRVEHILPKDVLEACIADGQVSLRRAGGVVRCVGSRSRWRGPRLSRPRGASKLIEQSHRAARAGENLGRDFR